MVKLSAKAARARFSELLHQVEEGEEVLILRHGRPVAKLVSSLEKPRCFPDLSEFRKKIKVKGKSVSQLVLEERKKERY